MKLTDDYELVLKFLEYESSVCTAVLGYLGLSRIRGLHGFSYSALHSLDSQIFKKQPRFFLQHCRGIDH